MSFASRSRWSDVAITSIAQFSAALGTFLVTVTLILALQQRGAGGLEVAALVICEALPMVVLGKLIGSMVDRVDSRLLLVLSGIGQVIACLALAQASSFGAVIGGAIALSVASGVAMPTRQALLPEMVTRDHLPRVYAIAQTAGSAGMMVGPALAGFMVGGIGVQRTIEYSAVLFTATIIAGLIIRTRRGARTVTASPTSPASPASPARPTSPASPVPPPLHAWSLRDDRLLWSATWGLTAVLATISAVNVVLVFFIMRTLGGTEQEYGLVDSMWTVGMLAGAWLFGRLIKPATTDQSLARWLFATLGIASVALVLVGSVQAAIWIVPCYLLGGMQNGGLNVIGGTLFGRRVPSEARGRANTALSMRVQAGALLGYVAGGLLLEVAEPRWIVIGCGALGTLAVCAAMPLVSRAARTAPLVPAPVTVAQS